MEKMPQVLLALRRHGGLSQATLAARMGVCQGTVSRIERGALTCTLEMAARYGRALGLRVSDIVGLAEVAGQRGTGWQFQRVLDAAMGTGPG